MGAALRGRRMLGERRQLRLGETRRPLQSVGESLLAHGLEQVADGLRIEGTQGVFVVRRDENHRWRLLEPAQVLRRLDSIHARHADIHQHDVRRQPANQGDRFGAVARFARAFAPVQLLDQAFQAVTRRRLVVDDQDLHAGTSAVGSTIGNVRVT